MKNVIRPQDVSAIQQQYHSATSPQEDRGVAGQRMYWHQPHEKTAIGGLAVVQLGVIQAVLPYGRTYRVALQDNRILVCTYAADTTGHLVFGVDDCTTLLPGTMVWVVHEPGSVTGTILAVQPSTLDEYGSYVPQETVRNSAIGTVNDPWQTAIRQAFTGRRVLPAWKGFRRDATPGEWGKCTRTGGMISLDPMLAVLQVNAFCGVSAHLPGLFLRLCGASYALFTKYSEETIIGRTYQPQEEDEEEQDPIDAYWDYGIWGATIPATWTPVDLDWYDCSSRLYPENYVWRWRGSMGVGYQLWTAKYSSAGARSMLGLLHNGWAVLRGSVGIMLSSGVISTVQYQYDLDEQRGDHEKDAKRFKALEEEPLTVQAPSQQTNVWDMHNKLCNWCIPAGQYAFPDKFSFSGSAPYTYQYGKICITNDAIFLDVAGNGIIINSNGVRITGRSITLDTGSALKLIGKVIDLRALENIQGCAQSKIHWRIEREVEEYSGDDTNADLWLHFNNEKAEVIASPRLKAPELEVRKLLLEECEGVTYQDEFIQAMDPVAVDFPAWGFTEGIVSTPSPNYLRVFPISPPKSIYAQSYDVTPLGYFGMEGLHDLEHTVVNEFDNVNTGWEVDQDNYPFL